MGGGKQEAEFRVPIRGWGEGSDRCRAESDNLLFLLLAAPAEHNKPPSMIHGPLRTSPSFSS